MAENERQSGKHRENVGGFERRLRPKRSEMLFGCKKRDRHREDAGAERRRPVRVQLSCRIEEPFAAETIVETMTKHDYRHDECRRL